MRRRSWMVLGMAVFAMAWGACNKSSGPAAPSGGGESPATATWTRTATPAGTATWTPTRTASPTFTATRTATESPTRTWTGTPTRTATVTWTRTETSTSTVTATSTNTPTATWTQTFTSSPTVTSTFTETYTPTETRTPTVTWTPSPTLVCGTGGTFGEPGTNLAGMDKSRTVVSEFCLGESGSVTAVRIYTDSAVSLRVGIYSNKTGPNGPDALLTTSGVVTTTASSWNTIPVSSKAVTAGEYWVGFYGYGGNSGPYLYTYWLTDRGYTYETGSEFPDPWSVTALSASTWRISAQVLYDPAAP